MTVKGKAVVEAFYGSGPKRSYFSSCSNGGRQALMEAQRYPADYDGIIAGAPANYWTHLLSTAITNLQATLGESYVPATKLPAIQAAAREACDAQDGVKDGVLENPAGCGWDPGMLLCKEAASDRCLTGPQVTALKKIYDGMRNGKGQSLFPGYAPGGEAEQGGWGPWITGDAPEKNLLFAFGTGFYKNMIFNDRAWDYKTFSVDRDLPSTVAKVSGEGRETDPVSRLERRGDSRASRD
jgi:feruloyl esterase